MSDGWEESRVTQGGGTKIGVGRTVWLILKLAGRRWVNRVSGFWTKQADKEHISSLPGSASESSDAGDGSSREDSSEIDTARIDTGRSGASREKRRGTPGRRRFAPILMVLMMPLFLWQGVMLSTQIVNKLQREATAAAARPEQIVVGEDLYEDLADYVRNYKSGRPSDHDLDHGHDSHELEDPHLKDRERQELKRLRRDIERDFKYQVEGRTGETLEARQEKILDEVQARGLGNFLRVQVAIISPDRSVWPSPKGLDTFLVELSLVLFLILFSLLGMGLGTANKDLGALDSHFEWLFGLPVPSRGLFLAKALEYSLVTLLPWFVLGPFFFVVFHCAGCGGLALPLTIASTLFCSVGLGCSRLAAETFLRKHATPARLKSLQAGIAILAILALYLVIYLSVSRSALPTWFHQTADLFPNASLWLPWGLPLLLTYGWDDHLEIMLGAASVMLVIFGFGISLTVRFCARTVESGLMVAAGPYQASSSRSSRQNRQGPREGLESTAPISLRVRSTTWTLLAKEIKLLARDRSFFVQTIIMPILIIGFQVVINPELLEQASANPRHGAMMAFGIGAYVLAFGAFQVLASETNSLWLLNTLPMSLAEVIRIKTRLWAAISLAYVAAILSFLFIGKVTIDAAVILDLVVTTLGIIVYARIATGLGTLATSPEVKNIMRRVSPGLSMLYMLLASLYAYAIYSEAIWPKVVMLTLCALVASAIWQKVHAHLPYILDRTARPRTQLGLSEGLIACLCFFVLQAGVVFVLIAARVFADPLSASAVAFPVAGGLVALGVLLWQRLTKVKDMALTLGLKRRPGSSRGLAWAAAVGLVAGSVSGLLGLGYLHALPEIVQRLGLRDVLPQVTTSLSSAGSPWVLGLLMIGFAPLVEEFLFRGMIFKGLRRHSGVTLSILASAAIFAMVHPPASVLPVFGLGIAAAIAFEFSGLLLAPIVCHAVYNTIVVIAQW